MPLSLLTECLLAQGVGDGSLSVLVEKVRSQPQISGAYKKTAPMRNRESAMEFCASIACLKVCSPPFACHHMHCVAKVHLSATTLTAMTCMAEGCCTLQKSLLQDDGLEAGVMTIMYNLSG